MKNEVISERQGLILVTLFIIGSSFLIGSGGQAKKDAWISVIIAMSWAVLLFLMFSRILSLYPGKDLFDIIQILMGKFMGNIISILMIWYAFHLGALVLRNISEFTNVLVLPDTPVILPMSFFTILLIWVVKEGIEVLGRWSEFFIWIVFIVFISITLLSIPQMDPSNLKPILNVGIPLVLKGSFSSFMFPFGEGVVFMMVFSNIAKVKNYNKTFIIGLLMGGVFILIATTRNILVLGGDAVSRAYFPSTMVISLIHLGNLLQRLESTVIVEFLICIIVKISICIFAVCNGISKLFGFDDYKFIATPIALLMLSFSLFVFGSTMEMKSWASHIYPYYTVFFAVLIPLVIFIMAEIKNRNPKNANSN
jgi:spore germination protein KB